MRLERDVDGCAPRRVARRLESAHFCMRFAPPAMPAFADDALVLRDHTANARIGMVRVTPMPGELNRALHEADVEGGEHAFV